MASGKGKQSLEPLVDVKASGESDTDSDAGANLRSPKDKARREKIIHNWKHLAERTVNSNLKQMYSSTFQTTLDHFTTTSDAAFEYGQDQTTLFNFPQKPIEQEALLREEVEIEQRVNRKRKETIADTQSFDDLGDKFRCTEELNFDLARKFPPCFQRINVGEQGAAGVGNFSVYIYCICNSLIEPYPFLLNSSSKST